MKRDLSTLDRDIGQDWSRIIQEAFAHGITNDMIFGGLVTGQTALQGLHALPVATQNCRLGTRRVTWDGRVYRYGSAAGTMDPGFLSQSENMVQELEYAAVAAGVDAGSKTISFIVGATDGDGAGNIAVDKLKDGYVLIHGTNTIHMRIESNTLGESGKAMTLTLEHPLPLAVTDEMYGEAMANPYADLQAGPGHTRRSFMGLPTVAATAALPYHWEQTWGVCWVTPNNGWYAVDLGNASFLHQAVAYQAGSVGVHDVAHVEGKYQQHIGYVLSRAHNDTQGAPFLMLQLCP